MSVEYDPEAKAVMKLLKDFESFNDDYIDEMADQMVKGDNSILLSRFKRNAQGNKTYRALKPKTKRVKKILGERYTMQASGKTKQGVRTTTKGKVNGKKVTFTADVPDYAKDWNDESNKSKRLRFFSLEDKNGKDLPLEAKRFNSLSNSVFIKQLSKVGIKTEK